MSAFRFGPRLLQAALSHLGQAEVQARPPPPAARRVQRGFSYSPRLTVPPLTPSRLTPLQASLLCRAGSLATSYSGLGTAELALDVLRVAATPAGLQCGLDAVHAAALPAEAGANASAVPGGPRMGVRWIALGTGP